MENWGQVLQRRMATYAYDSLGRFTGVTTPQTSSTVAYDVYSRPATLTAGNGMTTDYGYDVRGLLESISHRTSGSVDVLSLTYALNEVANVTDRTETGLLAGLDEAYAYDFF